MYRVVNTDNLGEEKFVGKEYDDKDEARAYIIILNVLYPAPARCYKVVEMPYKLRLSEG